MKTAPRPFFPAPIGVLPGFTLVELLTVIAIIGLLSTITGTAILGSVNKARIVRVKNDIQTIEKAIELARNEGYDTIVSMTEHGCTRCQGTTDAEKETYLRQSLARLGQKAGVVGLERITRNPWGDLYVLDENENEGSLTNCTRDMITSTRVGTYYFPYGSSYCLANPVGTPGWR